MAENFDYWIAKARLVHGDRYQYVSMTEGKRGSAAQITYICDRHGEITQARANHLRGFGCKKCSGEAKSAATRQPATYWLEKFRAVHGSRYVYPETFETGSLSRIDILCPEHGTFNQALVRHGAGDRCPACALKLGGEAISYDFYGAIARCEDIHGSRYLYLGLDRCSGTLYVKYLCKTHGYQIQRYKSHLRGHGCNLCAFEDRADKSRYDFEDVVEKSNKIHENKYNYLRLSPSTADSIAKLEIQCKSHGLFSQSVSGHLNGEGCPNCGVRISRANREIYQFVLGLGLQASLEHMVEVEGKRVYADVYVPEKKLVIEHLGLRWHSSKYKDRYFLAERQTLLENNGYSFIAVYEDEWKFNQLKVQQTLKARLGVVNEKVFARKCTCVEIGLEEAKDFIDTWHIQGYNSYGGRYLGLRYDNKLVAVMVMTNNTSDRKAKADCSIWELSRYCTSVSVVGGASRLLKFFLRLTPDTKKIVSFSDRRFFEGKTYQALGFACEGLSQPDYQYVVNKHRKHKRGFQKSSLAKLFPEVDLRLTEKEITENLGLYRIYDSGKFRWVKYYT